MLVSASKFGIEHYDDVFVDAFYIVNGSKMAIYHRTGQFDGYYHNVNAYTLWVNNTSKALRKWLKIVTPKLRKTKNNKKIKCGIIY